MGRTAYTCSRQHYILVLAPFLCITRLHVYLTRAAVSQVCILQCNFREELRRVLDHGEQPHYPSVQQSCSRCEPSGKYSNINTCSLIIHFCTTVSIFIPRTMFPYNTDDVFLHPDCTRILQIFNSSLISDKGYGGKYYEHFWLLSVLFKLK